MMPMLAISQKPERVSNILRSSVVSTRWVGILAAGARTLVAIEVVELSKVVVVMPQLLLAGSPR